MKDLFAALGEAEGESATDEQSAEPVDDTAVAKETAAADMIDAMKSGDTQSLMDAFQRMYDACSGASYDAGDLDDDE